MNTFFDIRTISLFSGLLSACLFTSMIYVYKCRKTYPGFKQWTFAFISNFVGFALLSLRNILPDFITTIVANFLIVLCLILVTRGLISFAKGKQNIWLDISPLAILIVLFFYFLYISPNLNARITVISLVMIFISLRCAIITQKNIPEVLCEKNWLLTFAFIWIAFWLLMRVFLTISHYGHINDFMSGSIIQGVSIITGIIGLIFIATGLIIINAQRLEKNLITAQKEIKTLRGILPICSYCKKIRNDKGIWNQIETYILEHSKVVFSHGICKDCAKKHYPELHLDEE